MPKSDTTGKNVKGAARKPARPAKPKPMTTVEVDGYLSGLYKEFRSQVDHYLEVTHNLLELEARAEIQEKNLRVTRDHLALSVEKAKTVTIPKDWTSTLKSVRFVGLRLADACVALLREQKRMTPEALFAELNLGMFRFRTSSPLREIHGALLRHPFAKREGQEWVWSEAGDQMSMHLRVLHTETAEKIEASEALVIQTSDGEEKVGYKH